MSILDYHKVVTYFHTLNAIGEVNIHRADFKWDIKKLT
jgi:hypothetical protein